MSRDRDHGPSGPGRLLGWLAIVMALWTGVFGLYAWDPFARLLEFAP